MGFGFTGISCTQKINKAQANQANITGAQYFHRLWYLACIKRSGVNFVLLFILFLFYFLTICANSPFCLRLLLCLCLRLGHSTLPPLFIACLFLRVLCSCLFIHKPLLLHRYNGPVQVPTAAAMLVKIIRDGRKIGCLRREVRLPAPLPFDASYSISSSSVASSISYASSVSSASRESSLFSPPLPPLSHSSSSEPPPPRMAPQSKPSSPSKTSLSHSASSSGPLISSPDVVISSSPYSSLSLSRASSSSDAPVPDPSPSSFVLNSSRHSSASCRILASCRRLASKRLTSIVLMELIRRSDAIH